MASGHVWLVAFPIPMDVVVDGFNLDRNRKPIKFGSSTQAESATKSQNQNWPTDWFMWDGFSVRAKDKSNPQGFKYVFILQIFFL